MSRTASSSTGNFTTSTYPLAEGREQQARGLARFWPLSEWILMGLAFPLLLFPGTWSFAGLLLVGIAWILRRLATGHWRLATPADPALALLGLTALVGTAISVDWPLSLNRGTVLLLGWLFYESATITLARCRLEPRFFVLVALASLLFVPPALMMTDWSIGILFPVAGLYEMLPQINPSLPGSGVPRSGGLLNPRTVAGAAAMLWPLNGVLALWGSNMARWQRFLHGLAALLLIEIILLTQSPQGGLALAGALLVLLFWRLERRGRLALASTTVAFAAAGLLLLARQPQQVLPLLPGRTGFGLVSRFEIWVRALRMVENAPLTGIGLNNYPTVMDTLYTGYLLGPEPHAHNLYLQTLTDQGLPGLLGLLLLTATSGWLATRLIRQAEDSLVPLLSLAVVATLAGWLAYGLLDLLALGQKTAIPLWLLLAIPVGLAQRYQAAGGAARLWLFVLVLLVLLGASTIITGHGAANVATVTAHRALFPRSALPAERDEALAWLELSDSGKQAQQLRLRARLLSQDQQPAAAAATYRELVAREVAGPLWWWAPAQVLTGEFPSPGSPLEQRGAALARIYSRWQTRYPKRVEPFVLLAFLYHDFLDDPQRAAQALEDYVPRKEWERRLLGAVQQQLR